jgi:hypothetical protein
LLARYFLNPNYSHSNLFEWLKNYNTIICEPPLPEKDVFDIWEYALIRIKSPDFYIKGNRDCFVHFFSTCSLSLREKQSVVRQSQVVRSKFAINEAIQAIINEGLPITKRLVAKYSGRKERTVTKYWTEFLPDDIRFEIEAHKSKYYSQKFSESESVKNQKYTVKVQFDEFLFESEEVSEEQIKEYFFLTSILHLLEAA